MGKRKDLTGNIYGELKVIEMLYNYQNKNRTYCRCIGINDIEYKEYIIRQDALQSGATNSTKGACTGGVIHDLTNQRFGMLVALYPTDKRASNGCVRWHCKCDCGNETNPDPTMNNLTRHHTLSCGCRKNSKWELFIQSYLESINIDFIPQKVFSDCKNKNNTCYLYFDFYLPYYNMIIEYDGQQHFEPIKIWGGEEKLKRQQENDEIKNQYCKNNNINLVRIPYTKNKEEIIQIINDIIRPATTTA